MLVLCHLAGATAVDEWPDVLIPPLAELAAALRGDRGADPAARPSPRSSSTPAHIADADEAREACAAVERETGRVCDDPVRFGADRLWKAVAEALPAR